MSSSGARISCRRLFACLVCLFLESTQRHDVRSDGDHMHQKVHDHLLNQAKEEELEQEEGNDRHRDDNACPFSVPDEESGNKQQGCCRNGDDRTANRASRPDYHECGLGLGKRDQTGGKNCGRFSFHFLFK